MVGGSPAVAPAQPPIALNSNGIGSTAAAGAGVVRIGGGGSSVVLGNVQASTSMSPISPHLQSQQVQQQHRVVQLVHKQQLQQRSAAATAGTAVPVGAGGSGGVGTASSSAGLAATVGASAGGAGGGGGHVSWHADVVVGSCVCLQDKFRTTVLYFFVHGYSEGCR